jgi:hypothetical protein
MKNILFLFFVLLGSLSCRRSDSGLGRIVETQSVPVFSDPAGAKVFVNGVEIGETPISLILRKDCNHKVSILKDGYVLQTVLVVRQTDGSCLVPEVIDIELEERS